MAINRANISTADITEVAIVAIEMVNNRPTGEYLDTAGTPNAIVGYYDYSRDIVELYVRDATGRRVLKVT
tara:strand:+ start:875 stop:1084 length:210 start_codon:yes stop_codon:yes gene_type:complete